ncbi:MAG TPA: hypothetical protein ENJ53_01005 [Phaeodactylibacter sp.]|nr:hypothetical protein [Phaeodactylibacter sp.]
MTLQQFFDLLGENNNGFYVLSYFLLIPVTALIAGFMGKNEGHLSPWKYLYTSLIYMVCVPGLFAITLNVYKFLFERGSIMDLNIYTQILPIISMIITLLLIRSNVSLDRIPGFGKLSGMVTMIVVLFAIMWFLEKTRIIIFSYMRVQSFLILLVVLLIIFRYGWSKMMKA